PYFGDAEPTTADELVPVGIASDRGYLTVGLHIDSEDWTEPGVRTIIDTTLAQLPRGNVILMHDGGGDRTQTIAALGPLIDSLRARGDTLVLVSELMGVSRAEAMPALAARSALARAVELASFGSVGVLEWVLYWVFLLALVIGAARLCFITVLAIVHRLRRHQHGHDAEWYRPSVSVIVPAYNEERVIVATVRSLLGQAYGGELEVVVVDDGSPDGTYEAAMAEFGTHPRVAIHRKPNGGKASALNYGLERARGEIVICLDADTVFTPDTVAELVAPLADPTVGAVAGNAKVGNRVNIVTRWQAIEYVTSQNLDRRAFSLLDCITVVPGAVGAWRRELVERIGGFSDDTLAEDQDLTLAIRREGYSIAYADAAVGYTEAPDTVRALAKQRFRWSFGTLQCAWKHRDVLFHRRAGSLGFVALPNVWIFQLLFPVISPVADLMFLWSLVSVWMVKQQHGATYALTTLDQVLLFYALFLLVDWLAAMVAFLMEPDEDKSLTWLVFLQRFVYRQVMYWVVVRSFLAAVRGHVVGWGKLERKATVEVPA
ncbi:MAG TPA: glycosyltransferase, partial [Gemmatimonadaceae bacterium]